MEELEQNRLSQICTPLEIFSLLKSRYHPPSAASGKHFRCITAKKPLNHLATLVLPAALSSIGLCSYARLRSSRGALGNPEAQVITVARSFPPNNRGWLAADVSTKIYRPEFPGSIPATMSGMGRYQTEESHRIYDSPNTMLRTC